MDKCEGMLKFVLHNNHYYKNVIKEFNIADPLSITQYPVLTRNELQKNRYNMFSSGYKSKYFNQQLRRQASSGSTGVPINVYWDYKDYYISNMFLWRKRLSWYGIHPNEKYVMFTLDSFNIDNNRSDEVQYIIEKNKLVINVTLLFSLEQYKKVVSIIKDFDPVWLYIQPSILNKLLQVCKEKNYVISNSLRYIESVGELLTSDLRRQVDKYFKVPIANMYGSEEMNCIALECPNHHMHIISENVHIEVKNENGIFDSGEGDAIITNLNNHCMPLIRYDQGDKILLNKQPETCSYDQKYMSIDLIEGRIRDCIIIDGVEINSFMLAEVISEVNNQLNDLIIGYNYFYYSSRQVLCCKIFIDKKFDSWFPVVQNRIHSIFISKLPKNTSCNFQVIQANKFECNNLKNKVLKIIEG